MQVDPGSGRNGAIGSGILTSAVGHHMYAQSHHKNKKSRKQSADMKKQMPKSFLNSDSTKELIKNWPCVPDTESKNLFNNTLARAESH